MNIATLKGASSAEWYQGSLASRSSQPLTWYKVREGAFEDSMFVERQKYDTLVIFQANFDAPEGVEPLALDMNSMGKGQIWINGQLIGRYWTNYAKGNCNSCKYAGTYRPKNCQSGCGSPTQRW